MTVKDFAERLGLTVLTGEEGLGREVGGCYVGDVLSDVLGHAREGDVWVTVHSHLNVVAVASLKGLACVVVVHGGAVAAEVLARSRAEGIPMLGSAAATYDTVGRIYRLLDGRWDDNRTINQIPLSL